VPTSAKFKRYAEVARKLAKQQLGSEAFMWAQLAQHWAQVADRMAVKEKAAGKVAPNGGEVHQP
jgi:hypothetical protein